MRTDEGRAALIDEDWNYGIEKWVATISALYLMMLGKSYCKTSMRTSLLVPYLFFSLPPVLFHFLRGEVGKWVACIGVLLRLFFPQYFPEWLERPGSLMLLLVVSPHFFAHTLRNHWVSVAICLAIGHYLYHS